MKSKCKQAWLPAIRRGLFTACLLLGVIIPLRSQEYVFRAYGQADGLRDLIITGLTIDTHGFLWVGTQNGLYRFLGSQFQRFGMEQGIAETMISSVVASPDGTVWANTGSNLYRWTGTRFEPAMAQPIVIDTEEDLAVEAPGRLLFVTGDHLVRLNYSADLRGSRLEPVLLDQASSSVPQVRNISLVKVAPDRTVWMACASELCHLANGRVDRWGPDRGLPPQRYGELMFDRKGSVWAVGGKHLLELPRGGNRWINRDPPGVDLVHNLIHIRMAEDRFGRILITSGDTIQRWDGARWQLTGVASGMPGRNMSALVFDPDGNLWLGTFGSGLSHWAGYEVWEGWREHQGLPSPSVWSIDAHDPAHITVGTEHGPSSINLRSGSVEPTFPRTSWKYGTALAIGHTSNGNLLFGTQAGDLIRWSPHSGTFINEAKADSPVVYTLFRASSGVSYLADKQSIQKISETSSGLRLATVPEATYLMGPHNFAYQACSNDGADWFGYTEGILKLKSNTWSRVTVDGIPPATPLRGLTCVHDGTFYISGTDYGLWHLVPHGEHLTATELPIPKADRSLLVLDLLSDSRGWLWVGTDDGLLVWNGSMWRHLTQENGLIWNDLNQSTLTEGTDGSLWMGTGGGLAHLMHPEQVYENTALAVALVEMRRGGDVLPIANTLQMPWSKRDLSIQYAATRAPNREDLVFRYRIAHLQPAWTESRDTTAHFQSLPPGQYTFEMYAQDQTSGIQSSLLTIQIRILPPWWRTVWAYMAYGIVTVLAISLLFRLRMRRVLAQKQRLEALVRERTAQLEANRQALHLQATHDGLTGLLNRMAILEAFEAEIQRAQRENLTLTLVIADIDHFKKINDTHGHLAGDEALRRFSSALKQAIRPYDHAGRYGGEEFMLVLPGRDCAPVQQRLNALHADITNVPVTDKGTEFVITCSLGAICLGVHELDTDPEAVLAAADEALYQAKHSGRNRVIVGELMRTYA